MVKRSSKLYFRAPSTASTKIKHTCSLIRPLKARKATFSEEFQVRGTIHVRSVKAGDRGALASLLAQPWNEAPGQLCKLWATHWEPPTASLPPKGTHIFPVGVVTASHQPGTPLAFPQPPDFPNPTHQGARLNYSKIRGGGSLQHKAAMCSMYQASAQHLHSKSTSPHALFSQVITPVMGNQH